MDLVWQGIILGLWLSILVGPILVVYLQLGIERGFSAGLTVAFGVWFSDLLFILTMYWGLNFIKIIIAKEGFENWLGLGGAVVLITIGLVMWFKKTPNIDVRHNHVNTKRSYFGYFVKGFLVNTLNPFPFFFWSGVMTSYFSNDQNITDISLLFGSILITVIITDILKIYLAKRLQAILIAKNILLLRQISGVVLFLLGLFLGISSIIRF